MREGERKFARRETGNEKKMDARERSRFKGGSIRQKEEGRGREEIGA